MQDVREVKSHYSLFQGKYLIVKVQNMGWLWTTKAKKMYGTNDDELRNPVLLEAGDAAKRAERRTWENQRVYTKL